MLAPSVARQQALSAVRASGSAYSSGVDGKAAPSSLFLERDVYSPCLHVELTCEVTSDVPVPLHRSHPSVPPIAPLDPRLSPAYGPGRTERIMALVVIALILGALLSLALTTVWMVFAPWQ